MLEDFAEITYDGATYRLVALVDHIARLRREGLDPDQMEEMIGLLRERGLGDPIKEVLDAPFEDKGSFEAEQTRFSDGTLRVFYSAWEPRTVELEMEHWYLKPILEGRHAPIRVYYRLARCSFSGQVKDLRGKVSDWPFLVADDGYAQCNDIGLEASRALLHGLLTQSARNAEGTCLPVFRRDALKNTVEYEGFRVFDFEPGAHQVRVSAA